VSLFWCDGFTGVCGIVGGVFLRRDGLRTVCVANILVGCDGSVSWSSTLVFSVSVCPVCKGLVCVPSCICGVVGAVLVRAARKAQ
jgi:hypothetical protein